MYVNMNALSAGEIYYLSLVRETTTIIFNSGDKNMSIDKNHFEIRITMPIKYV